LLKTLKEYMWKYKTKNVIKVGIISPPLLEEQIGVQSFSGG
jgi:hypothetical protein